MNREIRLMWKKYTGRLFVSSLLLVPVFANATFPPYKCSTNGYTIATINGVLTAADGARDNMTALKDKFGVSYNDQEIDYQYLLNPTHLGGLGDVFTSIYQKAFENEAVVDYDLIEMLNSASKKVKTQKLLLVAHSQGNFYANSFYDVVTKQVGGVPAKSIAVYGVANPAVRVAGGGKWLTSKTDKIIATVVADVPFKNIMSPNVDIVLKSGDDFWGHDFDKVYLRYQPKRIVEDIEASLGGLSKNTIQDENMPCISPPNITIAHKILGADLAYLDMVAYLDKKAVVGMYTAGADLTKATAHATLAVGSALYGAAEYGVAQTAKAEIATLKWTYHAGVAVATGVTHVFFAIGSKLYVLAEAVVNDPEDLAESNSASVILATKPNTKNPPPSVAPKIAAPTAPLVTKTPETSPNPAVPVVVPVTIPAEKPTTPKPPIKLIFMGNLSPGFGGGAPPQVAPQVLGTTVETPEIPEAPEENTPKVPAEVPIIPEFLSAPALTAPQCASSLATDGCLLTTTNLHFEWGEVSGAGYYATNKNGTYATTTSLAEDVVAPDFSDYVFEVAAVGADGQTSATSTQTVSVATIPVAINEVAWMGTAAASNAEWLELKNNTAHAIDLSSWALSAQDAKPFISLAGTIASHAFYLLERTGDGTISDRTADLVYGNAGTSWALENNGETLILSHNGTALDTTATLTRGEWPAGENSPTKKTMERFASKESGADPTNWGTNLGFIKNGTDAKGDAILGTPGERNSVSYLINKGQDVTSDLTLTADEGPYVVASSTVVSASSTLTLGPGVDIKFYEGSTWLPVRISPQGMFHGLIPAGWSSPAELDVQGALNAIGTPDSPVVFESLRGDGVGSLNFQGGTGTIEHAEVKNTNGISASNGAHLDVSDTEFLGNSTALDVRDSTLTIASSTIKDTGPGDAISLHNATSTITNVVVENGEASGIVLYGGSATIASTTVSGFADGVGITAYPFIDERGKISLPDEPTVLILDTEVTENRVGVMAPDRVIDIEPESSVHDNGLDITTWPPVLM